MNLLKTRFGLDDFKLAMAQISAAQLRLEHLCGWLAQLDLREDWLRQISFCRQGYQRQLLCSTPQFDLLLLCWLPGQASTIHDHGDSLNVTKVFWGELTSSMFEVAASQDGFEGHSTPILQRQEVLRRDDLATVDRHQIHQLANASEDTLVTLHVYARPLQTIQVYAADGQREQVAVHYPDAEETVA